MILGAMRPPLGTWPLSSSFFRKGSNYFPWSLFDRCYMQSVFRAMALAALSRPAGAHGASPSSSGMPCSYASVRERGPFRFTISTLGTGNLEVVPKAAMLQQVTQ